jgi:hypothetical protein
MVTLRGNSLPSGHADTRCTLIAGVIRENEEIFIVEKFCLEFRFRGWNFFEIRNFD